MVTLSERVTQELARKTLYSAGSPRQPHVDFYPLAMDRSYYSVDDHLLFSQETHQKESKTFKELGNTNYKKSSPSIGTGLVPVLNIRRGQEKLQRPMRCAAFESIIDHTLQYDPTTKLFHLWYFIYGFTPKIDPWVYDGIDSTPPPVASLRYQRSNVKIFNKDRFYVVAQRDLLEGSMPGAAKVLMYSTGDLVTLYDSGLETDRPYLLMKAPLPVAYWPFPITATSSGVSNISRSPINSSKSISARSQSGTPSRSQTTSRCPTFMSII